MKSNILKYILLAIVLLMILDGRLISQSEQDTLFNDKYSVMVTTKSEVDKFILRWAPKDYNWFTFANEYGYIIEKASFDKDPRIFYDDIPDEAFETRPLKGMPLMPWTVEEFKKNIKSEKDVHLGVAMEILHGEMSVTGSPTKGDNLSNSMMEQENRFAFALTAADLNRDAALSLALRYEDTDVEKGKFYHYRIYVNYADSEFKSDTSEFIIQFNAIETPKVKVENCFIEPFDKQVLLSWTFSNRAHFSAYDIERSIDNKSWKVLNEKPYISSIPDDVESFIYTYVDDTLNNYQKYYYRIIGYTSFGDKGLYSDVLETTPKDLTPPSPAFEINAIDTGGVVLITWDAAPYEPDFDGFYIGRSNSADGPFEKISPKLPKEERGFIDFSPRVLDENYYVIISSDIHGNESQSFSAFGYIIDSTPPEQPTWVSGNIDSTGMVRLEWNRGPEADIIGYRVYWANDTLSEFSQLTGEVHSHTVYLDSVNVKTLNKYTYYKITAVDHRYNHSEYSEILAIKKPDVIPPAIPVFSDYSVVDNKINFSWYVSSSDDVVTQIIEKSLNDENWTKLKELNDNTSNTYIDSTLIVNNSYSYRITAIDDSGNKTVSKPLLVSHNSKGKVSGDIQLSVNISEEKANLSWNTTLKPMKFILSKSNGDEFKRIAFLTTNQNSFIDLNYSKGDIYYIKAIMNDGSETPNISTK